jgi:hypothetical protein
MSQFFKDAAQDSASLGEKLLGPNYKYYDYIKTPGEMNMSSDGSMSTITNNISGIISYVTLLSAGGGNASKTGGPLGNKFFLETGATCKDKDSGKTVSRSMYVNNVPDGSIPFISAGLGDTNFSSFKGLIPGTLSNLAQINPMQIFGAFMSGPNPECQPITMETVNVNNVKGEDTAFVTTNDISSMSSCWFPNKINPVSNNACRETFTTLSDSQEYRDYVREYNKVHNINDDKDKDTTNYSIMPNDVYVKMYYSSISLLILYIFFNLFRNKN